MRLTKDEIQFSRIPNQDADEASKSEYSDFSALYSLLFCSNILNGMQFLVILALLLDRYFNLEPCLLRRAVLTPPEDNAKLIHSSSHILTPINSQEIAFNNEIINQPSSTPSQYSSSRGTLSPSGLPTYTSDSAPTHAPTAINSQETIFNTNIVSQPSSFPSQSPAARALFPSKLPTLAPISVPTHDPTITRRTLEAMPKSGQAIWFTTFADGSEEYRNRLIKFTMDVRQCHWFHRVKPCWDDCLDDDFKNRYRSILSEGKGHGYWAWKPYVILQTLHEMRDGDVLIFLDAGCTVYCTDEAEPLFREYVRKVTASEMGVLGFKTSRPEWWFNKQDFRVYMNATDEVWHSDQVMAGVWFMKKCDNSIKFVNEWIRLMGVEDGHFVDNSLSKLPNEEGWRGHRHDQSISSVLIKTMGGLIEIDTVDGPNHKPEFPFDASRKRRCKNPSFMDFEC